MGFNILIVKRFTCDDGSGAFDVKLQVRIDQKGDNFNWVILGGTGAYERLHGTGQGVGVYPIHRPRTTCSISTPDSCTSTSESASP